MTGPLLDRAFPGGPSTHPEVPEDVVYLACPECGKLHAPEGYSLLCDDCDRYWNPRDPFDTIEEARGER